MSDPIDSDYSSVTALTSEQRHKGLLTLVSMNPEASDIVELIDMLGLTDVANERCALRGLPRLREVVSSTPVHRDSTGRVRTDWTPPRNKAEAQAQRRSRERRGVEKPTAPRLCKCPEPHVLTDHTSETTLVSPSSGKRQCKFGEARRKRERRDRLKEAKKRDAS